MTKTKVAPFYLGHSVVSLVVCVACDSEVFVTDE